MSCQIDDHSPKGTDKVGKVLTCVITGMCKICAHAKDYFKRCKRRSQACNMTEEVVLLPSYHPSEEENCQPYHVVGATTSTNMHTHIHAIFRPLVNKSGHIHTRTRYSTFLYAIRRPFRALDPGLPSAIHVIASDFDDR